MERTGNQKLAAAFQGVKRLIVIRRIVNKPMQVPQVTRLLNDGYGYEVGVTTVYHDLEGLVALKLMRRVGENPHVYTSAPDTDFWPFAF